MNARPEFGHIHNEARMRKGSEQELRADRKKFPPSLEIAKGETCTEATSNKDDPINIC